MKEEIKTIVSILRSSGDPYRDGPMQTIHIEEIEYNFSLSSITFLLLYFAFASYNAVYFHGCNNLQLECKKEEENDLYEIK